MLQRTQTILLFLVAVCMMAYLATNTWHKLGTGEEATLTPYYLTYIKSGSIVKNTPVFYLAVLAVLSAGLSIFTIFQYKNRLRQMLLVSLNSLLGAFLLGGIVYHTQYDAGKIFSPEQQGDFNFTFWGLFLALILNWVANRLIRRDDKLVKSADRMR